MLKRGHCVCLDGVDPNIGAEFKKTFLIDKYTDIGDFVMKG